MRIAARRPRRRSSSRRGPLAGQSTNATRTLSASTILPVSPPPGHAVRRGDIGAEPLGQFRAEGAVQPRDTAPPASAASPPCGAEEGQLHQGVRPTRISLVVWPTRQPHSPAAAWSLSVQPGHPAPPAHQRPAQKDRRIVRAERPRPHAVRRACPHRSAARTDPAPVAKKSSGQRASLAACSRSTPFSRAGIVVAPGPGASRHLLQREEDLSPAVVAAQKGPRKRRTVGGSVRPSSQPRAGLAIVAPDPSAPSLRRPHPRRRSSARSLPKGPRPTCREEGAGPWRRGKMPRYVPAGKTGQSAKIEGPNRGQAGARVQPLPLKGSAERRADPGGAHTLIWGRIALAGRAKRPGTPRPCRPTAEIGLPTSEIAAGKPAGRVFAPERAPSNVECSLHRAQWVLQVRGGLSLSPAALPLRPQWRRGLRRTQVRDPQRDRANGATSEAGQLEASPSLERGHWARRRSISRKPGHPPSRCAMSR